MPTDIELSCTEEAMAALMKKMTLERNKPLRKTLFQPNDSLVHIHVGTDKGVLGKAEVFTVHKNLLCSRSDYFKAALTGGFAEANNFYRGLESFAYWSWVFDLYIFAEKRFIPDLQNAVMDALLQQSRTWIGWVSPETQILRVWPMISEGSPLRAYFVDCFLEVSELDKEFSEDRIDLYPVEFVVAIAVRAQKLKREPPKELERGIAESRCRRYHVPHRLTDQLCRRMIKPPFEFDANLSSDVWGKYRDRRDKEEVADEADVEV